MLPPNSMLNIYNYNIFILIKIEEKYPIKNLGLFILKLLDYVAYLIFF